MSPVSAIVSRVGRRRRVLLIVISAGYIECGLLTTRRDERAVDDVVHVGINESDGIGARLSSVTAAINDLKRQLEGSAGDAVDSIRVIIADCWLATAVVPWTEALGRSAQQAEFYVRAQLSTAGYDTEPGDTLRLDDARWGTPRLAVLYPEVLLSALRLLAESMGARVSSVIPLSVAALEYVRMRRSGRLPQVLAVVDRGLIEFAHLTQTRRPRLDSLVVRELGSGMPPDDKELSDLWQRLRLRDPSFAEGERRALLNLAGTQNGSMAADPGFESVELAQCSSLSPVSAAMRLAAESNSLSHAVDGVTANERVSSLRWLMLGTAVLLSGALMLGAMDAHQTKTLLRARLASLAQSVPKPLANKAWSREEVQQVQAVNAAIRELNLPVADILHALEPPRDIRVALLSIETKAIGAAAEAKTIKIVAQAHGPAEMTRYVGFVATRKPITKAYLLAHEQEGTQADHPYRFTLEATWSE